MKGDKPSPVQGEVQGRDIAKTYKSLLRGCHLIEVEVRQEPGAPVSSSRTDHGVDSRIFESLAEVPGALFVGSGQIPVAGKNVLAKAYSVAFRFEELDPALDGFGGCRRGRRDDPDVVAAPKRAGFEHAKRLPKGASSQGAPSSARFRSLSRSCLCGGDDDPAVGLLAFAIGHDTFELGQRLVDHPSLEGRECV